MWKMREDRYFLFSLGKMSGNSVNANSAKGNVMLKSIERGVVDGENQLSFRETKTISDPKTELLKNQVRVRCGLLHPKMSV